MQGPMSTRLEQSRIGRAAGKRLLCNPAAEAIDQIATVLNPSGFSRNYIIEAQREGERGGEAKDAPFVFDEKRALKRIQQGDKRAFEDLLERYESRVYRLAIRYTNSVADAEDLTQEIFLGIYRNIGGFRGASSISTWIYRVAVNHCLEFLRRKRPECVPFGEELGLMANDRRQDPVQAAGMSELSDEIEKALEKLSPLHRDVILLHELHGLTYGECAEVLAVPVGTVKSRLSNAFTRLRELLGGYVYEEA